MSDFRQITLYLMLNHLKDSNFSTGYFIAISHPDSTISIFYVVILMTVLGEIGQEVKFIF